MMNSFFSSKLCCIPGSWSENNHFHRCVMVRTRWYNTRSLWVVHLTKWSQSQSTSVSYQSVPWYLWLCFKLIWNQSRLLSQVVYRSCVFKKEPLSPKATYEDATVRFLSLRWGIYVSNSEVFGLGALSMLHEPTSHEKWMRSRNKVFHHVLYTGGIWTSKLYDKYIQSIIYQGPNICPGLIQIAVVILCAHEYNSHIFQGPRLDVHVLRAATWCAVYAKHYGVCLGNSR